MGNPNLHSIRHQGFSQHPVARSGCPLLRCCCSMANVTFNTTLLLQLPVLAAGLLNISFHSRSKALHMKQSSPIHPKKYVSHNCHVIKCIMGNMRVNVSKLSFKTRAPSYYNRAIFVHFYPQSCTAVDLSCTQYCRVTVSASMRVQLLAVCTQI